MVTNRPAVEINQSPNSLSPQPKGELFWPCHFITHWTSRLHLNDYWAPDCLYCVFGQLQTTYLFYQQITTRHRSNLSTSTHRNIILHRLWAVSPFYVLGQQKLLSDSYIPVVCKHWPSAFTSTKDIMQPPDDMKLSTRSLPPDFPKPFHSSIINTKAKTIRRIRLYW